MNRQVLTVEQMERLQKSGLELRNDTLLSWIVDFNGIEPPFLCLSADAVDYVDYNQYCIPAYTLQDVLDALPVYIEWSLHPELGRYELRIKRMCFDSGKVMYAVLYEEEDYINWMVMQSYSLLIDSAYEMLCWLIDNKFVEIYSLLRTNS